ncbi:MAG TPA: hypothetical protein VHZ95_02930 [Polyangiales bacterium]|nr:hypothetical protein [Polyangiales bacterium]
MALVASDAETWIALVLARGAELRRAGVLSIQIDGCSASFLPAEAIYDAKPGDKQDEASGDDDEPSIDPWRDPGAYPTGSVPSFGDIDKPSELPPILDIDTGEAL